MHLLYNHPEYTFIYVLCIYIYFTFKSSRMHCLVSWCMCTDVSEKHIAPVSVTEDSNGILRQYVSSKLIPQAARSNVWVCGHSACWNCGFESRRDTDVCLL